MTQLHCSHTNGIIINTGMDKQNTNRRHFTKSIFNATIRKSFFAIFLLFISWFAFGQPAKFGNALHFDGSNDYVDLTTITSVSAPFTVECWVKYDILSGDPARTFIGSRTNETFDIKIESGRVHGDIGTGTWCTTNADASGTYYNNTWYHIAYVVTSTGYSVYVNGGIITDNHSYDGGAVCNGAVLANGSNKIRIGSGGPNAAEYFKGTVDELRIWNVARTSAQIAENYNRELPTPTSQTGLVAYYDFNQGVVGGDNTGITSLIDKSGNNHNGTFRNMSLTGSESNFVGEIINISGDIPTPVVNVSSACPGGNVVLTVTNDEDRFTYGWWDNSSCTGAPLHEGTSYTINNMQSNATYYVRAYYGIESSFDYTGNVQTYTPEYSGEYKLEVWGAEGGNARYRGGTDSGGKGGYSYGNVTLIAGTQIYVVVGGAGANDCSGSDRAGGYNGGGTGTRHGNTDYHYGSGGGATHIAKDNNRGELRNYNSYRNEILIVAGGGGGASGNINEGRYWGGPGGSGGGTNGGNASSAGGQGTTATGGSQTSGGNGAGFGYGATGNSDGSGGGGGGWFGGGNNPNSDTRPSAGGSGYIGGVTGGSTSNGVRTGNGYAKITCIYSSEIATVPVELYAVPVVEIYPENPMICPGTTISLIAATADGYLWNNGATTAEITVGGGTYTVTATNSNGCSVEHTTTVTEVTPSAGEIDDVEVCYSDDEITLTSSATAIGVGTVEYRWIVGSITTSWSEAANYTLTAAERAMLGSGNYNITREYRDDCGNPSGSATGTLTINPPMNPPTVSGSTTIYCGQTATLTASSDVVGNLRYRWYSDPEGQNLVYEGSEFTTPALDAATTYYVQTVDIPLGDAPIDFDYTGDVQTWEVPVGVTQVKLEVWGAQGGAPSGIDSHQQGGKGGYSCGTITLQQNTELYIYVGGQGLSDASGFNGGGFYQIFHAGNGGGGGGASDIRVGSGSLYARVIVAGGGGGQGGFDNYVWGDSNAMYGYGGGLSGGIGYRNENPAGTQTSGFSFGQGGPSEHVYGGNGGGGWYGGYGAKDPYDGGCGGSGYVYTASTASNYPSGCLLNSSYYLTEAQTIAGNMSFLAPDGTNETGHTGNGYARITITDMADLPDICPSELVPVTVTVTTAPAPVVEVPNPNACQGDNVVLTITNPVDGLNYGWWDNSSCTGAPIHEGTSFTINEMLNDATYYVRINYNGVTCSSAITEVPVELYIRPSFTLNASSPISCNNTPVEFTITDATGNILRYEWSDGTITTDINHTVIPENTTTYVVTAYNDHCSASRSYTIAANAPNVTIISSDNDLCLDAGTQVAMFLQISGSLGEIYAWSTGENTSSINTNPSSTTTYTVTISGDNYACNTIVEHTVHVNPIVEISPVNPMICPGTTISLIAATADGYLWNNGASTNEINVGDGTYTVTATNSDGCFVEVATTVTEVIVPSAGEIDEVDVCYSDEEITLTSNVTAIGGGIVEYRWNVGGITTDWSEETTYTLTPAERATFSIGTYNITREYRDECGNSGNTTGTLTINSPMNPPTVSGSTTIYCGQTATLTASSDVVGNLLYRWYSDPEGQNLVYEGSEFTTPALDATTTYYLQVVEAQPTFDPIDFDYTGHVQTWEVPVGVTQVKLEVWGAEGGRGLDNGSLRAAGGKGGYSYGNYASTPGQTLYIGVGGKGTDGSNRTNSPGGYNGGGNGTEDQNDDESSGGGGGATHIATSTGTLSDIGYSNRSNVLIVAGGGGGGSFAQNGGYGGGTTGSSGVAGGAGGTENPTSSDFGRGENGSGTGNQNGVAGGGGGWSGGKTNPTANCDCNSAGGGSGYVRTSATAPDASTDNYLTDAQTIAGNMTFHAPNGTNETGHSGNGYARITITEMLVHADICPSELMPVTVTVTTAPAPVVEINSACIGTPSELVVSNPIDGFQYQWSTTSDFSTIEATGVTFTPTVNNQTTYYVRSVVARESEFIFDYTGGVQNVELVPGFYKLECYGAQGGSGGGLGGYSVGYSHFTNSTTLYVCVGGAGANNSGTAYGAGGYNGGARGGNGYGSYVAAAGGGGATHIAKENNRGVLANYNSHREEILIVAGGGGGSGSWHQANYHNVLGHGGGLSGNNVTDFNGAVIQGGTQNTGYAFGQGQNGRNATDASTGGEGAGGGGGGWYGGYAQQATGTYTNCVGAGGSGYIGGVESSITVYGNTYTSSTTSGQHTGNGYARITLLYVYTDDCPSETATVILNPVPAPTFTLSSSVDSYCEGQPAVELTAEDPSPDIISYQWSDGTISAEPSHTVNPGHTTTYTLTVTNGTCIVASQNILTIIVDAPDIEPRGSDNGECVAIGTEVTLNIANHEMYELSLGAESTQTNNYLPTYSDYCYSLSEMIYTSAEMGSAGTITSIKLYMNRYVDTRNIDVYMKHTTKSTFASNRDWENFSSSDRVGNFSASASGWITIELDEPFYYNGINNLLIGYDDNTGTYRGINNYKVYPCSGYQSIMVYSDPTNYNPSSATSYSARNRYTNKLSTIFIKGSPCSYEWSNASTGSSITVSPTETTTYTVSVTNGTHACPAIWDYTVKVNPEPTLASGEAVCIGTEATLTAGGGISYDWGDGFVAENTNVVTPADNTEYTVTVKNSDGCTASASATQNILVPGNVPATNVVYGHIWTGRESSDWSDSRNWVVFSDSGYDFARNAPSTYSKVAIRSGETCISNNPIVNIDGLANDVTVREGHSLTVSNGHSLSVNGDLSLRGNLILDGSSRVITTGDASIASGSTVTFAIGDTLNVDGNLTLDGSLSFPAVSPATADTTRAVRVGRDLFVNSGASLGNGGSLVFAGNGEHGLVNNTGSALTIKNNVELRRPRNGSMPGNIPHTVFPDGTIFSKATIFGYGILEGDITFDGTGRAIVCGGYESYASGTVSKIGGGSMFTFPTGDDNVLGSVSATIASGNTVYAKFHHKSSDNGDGTHGFGLDVIPRWWNVADMCPEDGGNRFDHVSNYEYWDISSPVGLSNVTLLSNAATSAEHFSSPNEYNGNEIQVAAYSNGCWKNFGGEAGISGSDHNVITIEGASIPKDPHRAVADFLITLGSKSKSTVLPIELTSFTATCDGRSALVEWTTATEHNNDYFSLERSDDAINFTEIARVAGAGNSIEPLDYSYTDYGIHGGDNYYRLVQVDYDGTRTATEIIVANCIEPEVAEPDVQAYPNPFNGELTLVLDNFGNRAATIEVYDMLGKLIYTEKASAPQNSYETILNLSNLPPAAYMVRVSTNDFVINRNVVKN